MVADGEQIKPRRLTPKLDQRMRAGHRRQLAFPTERLAVFGLKLCDPATQHVRIDPQTPRRFYSAITLLRDQADEL